MNFSGFDLSTIQDVYVGGTGFSYIYYGSNVVWQKSAPIHYDEMYLTLEALEPGTFGITIKSGTNPAPTYYSLDNGTTWNEFISGNNVSVTTGDKMLLKRDVSTGTYSSNDHTILTSTANFNVYGNSQSMIYSDNFIGTTDFNNIGYAFSGLFKGNTHLIDASNLILPATTAGNRCYYGMFQGCTSLTTAPELPATSLIDYCYSQMFQGCTSLTTAPALPATSLATYCYSQMFQGCTSLTTAPALPATWLYFYCYKDMFNGCTSLTSAPALPATSLGNSCYWGMFSGCTSLTTAPELPATTMGLGCYYSMFYNCTSLTTAPELPATTLASNCYRNMFQGCTSLTTAPELLATTLASNCYRNMFNRCTYLNYIKCLATDISATNCTTNWVDGVAAIGTFVKDANMSNWTTGSNGIPTGWTVQGNYDDKYMTLEALEPGTFGITIKSGTNPAPTYYSLDDGTTWNEFISGNNVSVTTGDKMLLKRDVSAGTYSYLDNTILTSTANFNVYGNSQSMIYSDNFIGTTDFNHMVCVFSGLFKDNTHLIDASNLILPVMLMQQTCYTNMFYGCTSLTAAPELPATTMGLGCYGYMFYGCTSLTTAPELPATDLSIHMSDGCYMSMFEGCTSLTTAPELPATLLKDDCYNNMFHGCTSLTTAPELPATTLRNNCYKEMFIGCTSLNYIKCLATDISATDCTTNWVDGVAATGTFVKDANMSNWTTGSNGIPTGWSVQDI